MYKVVLHRISTGDSLIVGESVTLAMAQRTQTELENQLTPWVVSGVLCVYILPVDGN